MHGLSAQPVLPFHTIYDKIGNLKKDVTQSQSRDIKFDGNNKQTEIKDSATGYKIGEYFYDGNGKRVKKRVFDGSGQAIEDVIFVYSGDRIIAEYSTQPPPQNPTTKYVATDMLGSIRAITNQDGQVVSRRDFMPFGEELQPDTNYRKASSKYNPDDVRQKFTGYQKDEESGLDFAEARMYNNTHGRFTAVDPLLASGKSANPQTFNRYVYTMNRPLNFNDPTGLQVGGVHSPCSRSSGQCDGQVKKGRLIFNDPANSTFYVDVKIDGGNPELSGFAGAAMMQGGPFGNYPYPNPNGDPIGYELSRVEDALGFIGQGIRNTVYDVAPDYGKIQWATPVFAVEFSMTKDFDFFAGGNGMDFNAITDLRFVDSVKSLKKTFKPIPTIAAGRFVRNVPINRQQRVDAMIGGNVNLNWGFGPVTVGASQSLPTTASVDNLVNSPTAIEIGSPSAGLSGGIGGSTQVLHTFSEYLRNGGNYCGNSNCFYNPGN